MRIFTGLYFVFCSVRLRVEIRAWARISLEIWPYCYAEFLLSMVKWMCELFLYTSVSFEPKQHTVKRSLRSFFVMAISVFIIVSLFRMTEAGSLTPALSPASTMNSLEDAYNALVGSSFDSSLITADKNGSAMQVAKCIIDKMTGGTPCP